MHVCFSLRLNIGPNNDRHLIKIISLYRRMQWCKIITSNKEPEASKVHCAFKSKLKKASLDGAGKTMTVHRSSSVH